MGLLTFVLSPPQRFSLHSFSIERDTDSSLSSALLKLFGVCIAIFTVAQVLLLISS